MIKVKDLKEFLKECDDNSIVLFEYDGFQFVDIGLPRWRCNYDEDEC